MRNRKTTRESGKSSRRDISGATEIRKRRGEQRSVGASERHRLWYYAVGRPVFGKGGWLDVL